MSRQKDQTIAAATEAVGKIEGASFVVTISFIEREDGAYVCEAGCSGTGKIGFPVVVEKALVIASKSISDLMRQAEAEYLADSQADA